MENVSSGICQICSKYPSLNLINESTIRGIIPINKVINDEHIVDSFKIEIDFGTRIPTIKELEDRTKEYKHKYTNGSLCLETNFIQLMYLKEHTYLEWFEYFVINYFCSFNYFKKYKCFPFGERKHFFGDIQGFMEFTKLDFTQSMNLLKYILKMSYRGHDLCPCNSGKKVRNCHKETILELQHDEDCLEVVNKLYEKTMGELSKYEKERIKKNKHF